MKNICITELVTANNPVSGYPLLQAVLVFHVVMWIAQVTQIISIRGRVEKICCLIFTPASVSGFSPCQ